GSALAAIRSSSAASRSSSSSLGRAKSKPPRGSYPPPPPPKEEPPLRRLRLRRWPPSPVAPSRSGSPPLPPPLGAAAPGAGAVLVAAWPLASGRGADAGLVSSAARDAPRDSPLDVRVCRLDLLSPCPCLVFVSSATAGSCNNAHRDRC